MGGQTPPSNANSAGTQPEDDPDKTLIDPSAQVRLASAEERTVVDPNSPQSDRVDVQNVISPRHDHKWRYIPRSRRHSSDHRRFAYPSKLVHSDNPADRHQILDSHMPGQRHVIGNRDLVVHRAVVPQVAVSHHEVVVPNRRLTAFASGAMDRDVLSKDVAIPDHEKGFSRPIKLAVLRIPTENGTLSNEIVGPHRGPALDRGVRI